MKWLVPIIALLPQLVMTFNSFNQMRFEEFYEAVAAPFWFEQRQVISGLHVNVGWYAFLVGVYNISGFSLYTGKITYLVMGFFTNFALFYLLQRFFRVFRASLILLTVILSPTYLFMNALNLHWALTFHILIAILLLLYLLDFAKKRLSMVITGTIFFLMMWGWLSYQAFVFYIPSLVIFYLRKYNDYNHYNHYKYYIFAAVAAFLLPLALLFLWVDNKQILLFDPVTGSGLFRGGGKFVFSSDIFSQAWTNFLSDFFVKGVSHHYEVAQAEFSLLFPILTLVFVLYNSYKNYNHYNRYILLAVLVIVFNLVVFSTTSDLGMPGMKRLTPMLVSFYFLWILAWRIKLKVVGMVLLSLLTIHHLIVYPINLSHLKNPSPFKVIDWDVERSVKIAEKEDLNLDCRPIVAQLGGCSYDFIYPAVAGSCKWNDLSCHQILGYDSRTNSFIPLSIDLWQTKYWEK